MKGRVYGTVAARIEMAELKADLSELKADLGRVRAGVTRLIWMVGINIVLNLGILMLLPC